jgi:hypothetical protein
MSSVALAIGPEFHQTIDFETVSDFSKSAARTAR